MERPRIVVAHMEGLRFFDETDMTAIAEVGDVLDPEPIGGWDDPRADDLLARAQVILGHWGCPRIDASVLDRAPDLGLVAYAAGTLKEVVTADVFTRGLRVTSGADANAAPVAEFTLGAILLAGKDAFWRRELARDLGLFGTKPTPEVPIGNYDKTIGIIGASLVGRRVIDLLRPFPHLSVVLYDPFVTEEAADALGVTKVELDELCATADIVSIHAPDLPSTRHMIAGPQLAAMRTGATLINTARGALVDHNALLAEVDGGRLSAILDVTDPEPLPAGHPLLALPNVVVTPHLAGSEGTELRRMTAHAVEEIRRWVASEPPRNGITPDMLDRLA